MASDNRPLTATEVLGMFAAIDRANSMQDTEEARERAFAAMPSDDTDDDPDGLDGDDEDWDDEEEEDLADEDAEDDDDYDEDEEDEDSDEDEASLGRSGEEMPRAVRQGWAGLPMTRDHDTHSSFGNNPLY